MSIARGTVVTAAVTVATALVMSVGVAAQAEDAAPTPAASTTSTAPSATATTAAPTTTPTPSNTPSATPKPSATPTPTATPKPKPKAKWVYMEKVMTIGRSAKGRPIVARYKGYRHAKRVLLVLGQMHGDEPAGPRVALAIRHHYRPKVGTGVWIIDTMNPDGAARGTRVNGRGVDLNRNWKTKGWSGRGKGTRTWGGPSYWSEPETRAIRDFLIARKPDYIASFHQPFGVIAQHGKDPAYQRRLAKNLRLPLQPVGVGTPGGKTDPTLTAWYNKSYLGRYGTATTIELPAKISETTLRRVIAPGTMRAALVR